MARRDTTAKATPAAKTAPARGPAKAATSPRSAPKKPAKVSPVASAKGPKAAPATPTRGRAKAATAKAAAAQPKPTTVTLKHLAAGLSESRGLPKRDAEAFAADLIGRLVEQVKGGAKVRIAGLGVIEVKDRPARMARNPATGEPVQVEASRKIAFRAAKELKDAI